MVMGMRIVGRRWRSVGTTASRVSVRRRCVRNPWLPGIRVGIVAAVAVAIVADILACVVVVVVAVILGSLLGVIGVGA
jgi:hypothetical protein